MLFFHVQFLFPSGEPTIRVMQIEKKNISIFVEEMFIAKETCLIETISLFDIVSILFTKELWGYLCWKDFWKIYREM